MSKPQDAHYPMPNNDWGCFLGGLAFSGVFALAGAGFLYVGFIAPYLAIRSSQNWIETPCEILKSEARQELGHGPNRPSQGVKAPWVLDIQFRYEFAGKQYVSERYGVSEAVDGREDWRREVVARLPKGANTICYVNPARPEEAAISREFNANRMMIFVPLVLLLLGLGGIACVLIASVPNKKPE